MTGVAKHRACPARGVCVPLSHPDESTRHLALPAAVRSFAAAIAQPCTWPPRAVYQQGLLLSHHPHHFTHRSQAETSRHWHPFLPLCHLLSCRATAHRHDNSCQCTTIAPLYAATSIHWLSTASQVLASSNWQFSQHLPGHHLLSPVCYGFNTQSA